MFSTVLGYLRSLLDNSARDLNFSGNKVAVKSGIKIIVKNRKAFHDYEIIDRYEAGIVLRGAEVKSVKFGEVSIKESFIRVEGGELWLWNCHISPWKYSSDASYDPLRSRKLLLKRKEIDSIMGKVQSKGLTLIPLSMYLLRGKVKVEIGLCRGLKRYQKREREKERDLKRDLHDQKRKYMI